MKWKHKQNGRIVEVIDDEKNRRYYVWQDDAEQNIHQWDLIYGPAWDDTFDKVK